MANQQSQSLAEWFAGPTTRGIVHLLATIKKYGPYYRNHFNATIYDFFNLPIKIPEGS
ncbi:hypothetical protein [Paenibacillus sp. 23TSA30-6]|uniref:hypothetical protein n=1 Tax=Paenibacillus sp. 23TSA30-6 TaxID=2546104 RepID=UPI001788365E|nr:hypothetical protein [Paenibacillus sp. 23TSA30-6]